MAKIKPILILFVVVFVLLPVSCQLLAGDEYECNVEKIKSVEIVRLGEWPEEGDIYDYTVLATVTDCVDFGNRLNRIKYTVNWGGPSIFIVDEVAIKIEYVDGDYDLINDRAQVFNRSGKIDSGYFFFNEKQFDALMSEYYTE